MSKFQYLFIILCFFICSFYVGFFTCDVLTRSHKQITSMDVDELCDEPGAMNKESIRVIHYCMHKFDKESK